MNNNQVLIIIIIACLILSIIMIFPKFFKLLGRLVFNAVVGLSIIWLINMLISSQQLKVGLNFITAAVTAVLGIPGVLMLYIIQYIL